MIKKWLMEEGEPALFNLFLPPSGIYYHTKPPRVRQRETLSCLVPQMTADCSADMSSKLCVCCSWTPTRVRWYLGWGGRVVLEAIFALPPWRGHQLGAPNATGPKTRESCNAIVVSILSLSCGSTFDHCVLCPRTFRDAGVLFLLPHRLPYHPCCSE